MLVNSHLRNRRVNPSVIDYQELMILLVNNRRVNPAVIEYQELIIYS
jgi:hypothetical protein